MLLRLRVATVENKKGFAEELGKRIREAREKEGITQTSLAKKVHKAPRTISEYEAGERNMYAADIPLVAAALKVSVSYLLLGSVVDPTLMQSIIAEFEALPDDRIRQIAVDLVRVLNNHSSDISNS